jgi:hypothetical protein
MIECQCEAIVSTKKYTRVFAGKPGKANGDFLEKFPFQELIE